MPMRIRGTCILVGAVLMLAAFSPTIVAQDSKHTGILTTKPSDVSQKVWDYYTELVAAGDPDASSTNVKWVCFVDAGYDYPPVTSTTFFVVTFSNYFFSIKSNRDGVYADDVPVTSSAFYVKDAKGKSVNTPDASTYLYNREGTPPLEAVTVVVDRSPFSFDLTKSYTTEGDVRANIHFEEEVTGRFNIHIVVPTKGSKSSTPFDLNITGRCYAPAWNNDENKK